MSYSQHFLGILLLSSLPVSAPAQQELKQDPVTVESLIAEAQAKHPAIVSAKQMVTANQARVSQAKALPDPKVSVSWMGNAAPFKVMSGDPSSYRGLAAMQEVPLGGKLRLKGLLAERTVQASSYEVEQISRQIASDVKTAFYEYWYATKALGIATRNRELLQKLSKIAETRYQIGKAMQADVLRSHVELSRLQQKVTLLTQQRKSAMAKLNSLLVRPSGSAIAEPVLVESVPLTQSLELLVTLAKKNDVEIQRRTSLLERDRVGIQLAQKEFVPDLAVGYMYQQRQRMPDMQGWTFTVNIPVFYKSKQQQTVNAATAEAAASQHSLRDREREVAFEVEEQFLAAQASENLMKLYAEGIVPQSSLALESALASYEVGQIDFLTLMTNFLTVLDYETEYYREVANQKAALARLEPLVGIELVK